MLFSQLMNDQVDKTVRLRRVKITVGGRTKNRWTFICMFMDQAKVNKVLGLKKDLRIFKKGEAMQSLIHDDNVV